MSFKWVLWSKYYNLVSRCVLLHKSSSSSTDTVCFSPDYVCYQCMIYVVITYYIIYISHIFLNFLSSEEGNKCMWDGARFCREDRATLAYWISYVSHFLPCRPAISCSKSHSFATSQTDRPISTSWCNLYGTMPSSAAPHTKSRCPQYPGSKVERFPVPDDKVDWSQNWPQYNPVSHTNPAVLKMPEWADPDIGWVIPDQSTYIVQNNLACCETAIRAVCFLRWAGVYSCQFLWLLLVLQLFPSTVQRCGWLCGQNKLWGQLQNRKWKATVSNWAPTKGSQTIRWQWAVMKKIHI